jgi:CRISPR/Cas system type I-B associated protein Csh2 (Cas7 group RAMP superfamily)
VSVCTEWIDMRDLGQVIEHEAKACSSHGMTVHKAEN